MKITVQKRLAASLLKISPKKVKLDPTRLADIKEGITKADVRALVSAGVITVKRTSQQSRGRTRHALEQKRKGRRQGLGKRKGTAGARLPSKDRWVAKVRAQRKFLELLKEKQLIDQKVHRDLYRKVSGGYFRNVRHIKLHLEENKQK